MVQCSRAWVNHAVATIAAFSKRPGETNLLPIDLPHFPGISLYLKDESTHLTGSLKHRLARSHAICSGLIGPRTPTIEASSGSTAVSEAYFARMLDLPVLRCHATHDFTPEGGPDCALRRPLQASSRTTEPRVKSAERTAGLRQPCLGDHAESR
jgi:hypothetical protein